MATNVVQLPFHPGAGLEKPGATIGEQLQSKGQPLPSLSVPPAPPPPNIQAIVGDPKFQALSGDAQVQVLSSIDPSFAALPNEAQQQVLAHMATQQPASFGHRFLEGAGLPTGVPKPPQSFKDLALAAVAPATEAYQKAKAPLEHAENLVEAIKKGDGQAAAQHLGNFLDSFIPGTGNAQRLGQETIQDVQKGNVSGVAGTASGLAAQTALATGVAKAPSAARAASSLEEVKAAAGSVPIDMSKAGDTALELFEQSQKGATLPKVVRDFVNRATKPGSDPITYGEAKDFQSNVSALSAEEKMAMKPNTKRLLGQLNADLKDSLEGAADTVGKGQQFAQAMQEYHNAMRLQGFTDKAIKAAIGAGLTSLGIGGIKKLWEAF